MQNLTITISTQSAEQSSPFFTYLFDNRPVRVVLINGDPWFAVLDVCNVLGYANSSKALKDHCKEKGVTVRYSLTGGGNQQLKYINEGNLYRLIVKSRKPEAEPFESWVCDEVLPTIRKTGTYSSPQARPALINPRDLCLLKAAVDSSVHNTLARNSNKEAVENYLKVMFRVEKLELIPESQAQAARNAVQQVSTYVNDLRSMLIGFEKEAFSGYITGNAPHIPSLKRKYKAALDAAKPQTPDIAKLVARDWLSKNGLMTA